MKVRSLFSKHGHQDVPEVGSNWPEMVNRKWAGSDRKYENIQTIVDSYKVQIENRWNLFKDWTLALKCTKYKNFIFLKNIYFSEWIGRTKFIL